jgi:fibrillarin-like rRNA methylase
MKILIDNNTSVVVAGGEFDFTLSADCVQVTREGKELYKIYYLKSDKARVVDVDSLPEGFAPLKFLIQDGEFVPNPRFESVK